MDDGTDPLPLSGGPVAHFSIPQRLHRDRDDLEGLSLPEPIQEPTDHARFLILTGGAFRGGVQVLPMAWLLYRHEYQVISGVSVGAVNGVMGAQGKIDVLLDFWKNLNSVHQFLSWRWGYYVSRMLGLVSVSRRLGHPVVGGAWSMAPLERHLTQHVRLRDFHIPFQAGLLNAHNGHYRNIDSRKVQSESRLVTGVLGSACMAPIMQPPQLALDGDSEQKEIVFDGGARNISALPRADLNRAREAGKTVHIDLVGCMPFDRFERQKRFCELDDEWEMVSRQYDLMLAEVYDGDFRELRELIGPNGQLHLYLPDQHPGSSFDASAKTRAVRFELGKDMIRRGPKTLRGL